MTVFLVACVISLAILAITYFARKDSAANAVAPIFYVWLVAFVMVMFENVLVVLIALAVIAAIGVFHFIYCAAWAEMAPRSVTEQQDHLASLYRGVIDFYRAAITDNSDKEIIKVAFHDALEALSATPTDYDKDPVKFCFESGIGDLCDLIPDELLNDPKMLLELEQALIATLAPHILDGTYDWQYLDDFQYFLEEQELDEFPSLDTLANLKVYLDAMEDDTVSPLDYDNSRVLSHPIPDRLLNAVSNAREEIDALAAEKESQRLRKTLVDELSNLRNSKTADDDKS